MDINSLSPSIREALLARNIISDTVTENGLSGLLYNIGNFTSIGETTQSVQASSNLEDTAALYQDLLIINNKYQGTLDDMTQISIVNQSAVESNVGKYGVQQANLLENSSLSNDLLIINNKYKNSLGTTEVIDIKTYQPLDSNTVPQPYSEDDANKNLKQSEEYRKSLTTKSKYLDFDAQLLKDIITSPVVTNKNYSNYLEETKGIAGGGVVSTASSIIDGLLGGVLPNTSQIGSPNPYFEIEGILNNRNIDSNETPLGLIAANQLAFAIQANVGANLYEETLGNINMNPLSVMMGNSIIVPNYSITVGKGGGGKLLNYTEKILGVKAPVSLFERSSSIFQAENPVPNITRGNSQIDNSGRGQVLALFANLQASLRNSNATKSGYAPGFIDPKNPNGGINPNIYAFSDNVGGVIDLLHGSENNPISQSNYQRGGMIANSGFIGLEDLKTTLDSQQGGGAGVPFAWNDPKVPMTTRGANFQKKTLLSKTQALFNNSSKMINLMTTKYTEQLPTEINSSVVTTEGVSYMSKGSAIRKFNGQDIETDPSKMFSRTWTTFDRYDGVDKLQKHSGLDPNAGVNKRGNLVGSVLDDNGFVRIAPFDGEDGAYSEQENSKIRNFMFSIENLAWADDLTKLIPSEVGPGDITNGKRGRIMWFPPYEMNFVDNTNINWEKTDFIGRGEPIYTYNNTERTGNLQFKIIIDHPAYVNSLKGEHNDIINSFFAGAKDLDPRVSGNLSPDELNTVELAKNSIIQEVNDVPQPEPSKFSVYFPYDKTLTMSELMSLGYENGLDDNGDEIEDDPEGENFGLIFYESDGGYTIDDNTNYGYNFEINSDLTTELQNSLRNECPACKITLTVYGNNLESDQTKSDRLGAVYDWFKDEILDPNDPIVNKRIVNGGTTGVLGPAMVPSPDPNFPADPDILQYDAAKAGRKVTIKFEWDAKLAEELNPSKKTVVDDAAEIEFTDRLKARFYNEIGFFQKLQENDKFVYDSLAEKIHFFHPSFHSITPEGFNSRLTFLQQCTRQGPTHFTETDEFSGNDLSKPDNLAFGRPPVCILRIGDFYHTKIVIDTLNFSYEPLVWDLNPEGVGVQPMICTVDLNFAFLGGSSLQGPINKLQNAVSFNYFANAQVYDPRADSIKVSNDSGREYVEGEFPNTPFPPAKKQQSGISNNTNDPDVNQVSLADDVDGTTGGAGTNPPVSDGGTGDTVDKQVLDASLMTLQTLSNGYIKCVLGANLTNLTKPYNAKLQVYYNSAYIDVATGQISITNNVASIESGNSWRQMLLAMDGDEHATFRLKLSSGSVNINKSITYTVSQVNCGGVVAGDLITDENYNALLDDVINNNC